MRRLLRTKISDSVLLIVALIAILLPGNIFAFDGAWDSGHNTTNFGGPQPPNPPPGNPQGTAGEPVNLQTGNFLYNEKDFVIPAPGLPLHLIRFYNNQDRYSGPFGHGWHFLPLVKLIEVAKGPQKYVLIKRGDGIRIQFRDNGDGTYTPPVGWYYQLSKSGANYALKERGGTVYNFDASGKLTSIADRNGNQLSMGYDSDGRIISMTDAAQRQVTFSYGAHAKIIRVTDFAGRQFKYDYDSNDNLVRVTDPLNQVTFYTYDNDHRLLSVTNSEGVSLVQNTFNSSDGVVAQDYKGGTYNFTYYSNYTRVRNRRGYDSDIYYNGQGNPARIIDPSGQSTYFYYGDNANLVRVSDWDGDTDYIYDSDHNISAINTTSGITASFSYEQVYNQVTSATDPLSHRTDFQYDANGNLTKTTDALGQVPSLTTALFTTYEYDTQGKLTKVITPDNIITTFTHSAAGYLTSITDTIGSDSYTVSLAYNLLGDVTTITRPSGATIVNEYDAVSRITKVTDNSFSPARVYEYRYDGSGNIISITENGISKVFSYASNRVTKINYPDGANVTYTYNPNDLFTSVSYALGTISYTYDNTDRVTKVTNPDASEASFTYTNDYLTRMVGPGIDLRFLYDSDRRLVAVQDALASSTISFSYDDAGNRTQMVDAAGGTTTYSYDNLNRLVSLVDPQSGTSNFSPPIPIKGTTILNEIISAYNFDEKNRLINLVTARTSGDIVADYSFEYPDVRYQSKTFQANKRWHSQIGEDTRDKRGIIILKSPFELIK